jgi:hypothetical protein
VPGSVEVDGLRDDGALDDASMVEIAFSPVWSEVRVLFDCKGALNIQEGNAAVLVAHEVTKFEWSAGDSRSPLDRRVEQWIPSFGASGWNVRALIWNNCTLVLEARSAEMYVGDVAGGDDAPPDFGRDDEEAIRAGLAGWASEFYPVYRSVARSDDLHR